MKYLSLISLALVVFFATSVNASEITGTLNTGVSTGSGVNGFVIEQPTATPPAGTYTSTQNVVLSGGAGTVDIRYTTDGSSVTCTTGNIYSTPIEVASSLLIEAISCYPEGLSSTDITFAYAIDPPAAPSGGGGGGGGIATTPSTANYDFNSDGNIDVFDFNILIVNWGSVGATDKTTGDANSDGNVDIFDFNLLIINWQS